MRLSRRHLERGGDVGQLVLLLKHKLLCVGAGNSREAGAGIREPFALPCTDSDRDKQERHPALLPPAVSSIFSELDIIRKGLLKGIRISATASQRGRRRNMATKVRDGY